MTNLCVIIWLCFLLNSLSANAQELSAGIELSPDAMEFFVVEKVPVADCRVVRGFLGTPVDGSVFSRDYRGEVREYPDTASDGVAYSFNNNDGLHITLEDNDGFDVIVLRGGARSRLYTDVLTLHEPINREPLWVFEGGADPAIVHFKQRVKAKMVSFFRTGDGTIADVGFYRLSSKEPTASDALWRPGESITLQKPETEFAPDSLYSAMNERYPQAGHRILELVLGKESHSSLSLAKGENLHFITPLFEEETGLSAISLNFTVTGFAGPLSLSTVVQDPLDPRLDLLCMEFIAPRPGQYRVQLDITNQVLLKDTQLWFTMRFGRDVILSGPQGSAPEFQLDFMPREQALPEALAWRKLLLKSFFSLMSEPRPWGAYRKQSREEFYASDRYARQCPELFMTIDRSYALDPTDDRVRQYREWVFLKNLDRLSTIDPPPLPPDNVPAWAWYSRMAWLEVRKIAHWWIENRVVPTGELGGRVGDDSDLYQQFADLPYFERDGVAEELMKYAARMATLADRENLRDGLNFYTTDALHAYEEGINHLALMARWFYGDPIYFERCMESARNMEKLTILTDDGRRHFRSFHRMGFEDIDNPREPEVDGGTSPLMWHTAFQVADYNRNPRTLKILGEWADTWLQIMKPGQWATEVDVRTGEITEFQKDRPLYGGYSTQASTFTWLYALTGDKRYIEPFLHYFRQGIAPYPSDAFLGDVYPFGALDELDSKTKDALAAHTPALVLYLNRDSQPLIQTAIGSPENSNQGIGSLFDAYRWPDMYTITEPFTDRIFPNLLEPASISYLGGFTRRNKFNPTQAVSWEGFGTDYAALVIDNRYDGLKVLVYSFSDVPMEGAMRVWNLEHGNYQLSMGPDENGDHVIDSITKTAKVELAKANTIGLTLLPKTVTLIELKQVEKLDSIFSRADLAITAREVEIRNDQLTGTVHNIGSDTVRDAVVAIVDSEGNTIARQSLGRLTAPVDLIPRQQWFVFQLPGAPKKGWKIVLDPEHIVPEIYEGNNEVALNSIHAAND